MATKREQLEKLVRDMEQYGDELDKRDAIGAEDVTKLNTMGADVKALADAVKAEADATGTLDDAKAFLASLSGGSTPAGPEIQAEPLTEKNGIVNPQGGSLGSALAKSPAYTELVSRYKTSDGRLAKGFGQIPLFQGKSFGEYSHYGQKTLVTGVSSTQAGAFIQNQILPGTVDLIGERELTIRDLCTNINIQSDTFEFVRITGKTNNAAPVPEATTSATPGLNDVPVGAYTAAHGLKPESGLALDVVTSPVETIAHLMPITRRAAADSGQMRAMVDAFLLYGLKEEEEDQILNGSGTSPNLRGILNTAGINTVGSAGTDIDAIVDGIAAIRADRRRPTGMVVHPNDWYSTGFLTAKDTAGNYLLGDPRASIEQLNTLWGLRVVVTEAMTENTILIGDFRQAVVADRQESTIYVTDSHNDWFARNILAVLAEERLGFGILDVEAFCTVTAV